MTSIFCQEISALENIAAKLSEREDSEESLAIVKALISIKDRLNTKLVEMEEYYMRRIEFYQERSRIESEEMEGYASACSNKYIDLLVKTKKLKSRIDEAEAKNIFYKSRMTKQ